MFQPVASLDGSRKEGVINFRLQNEVKDMLEVALRSVRRQAFQQDGARHGVHGDVCGFHVVKNLLCAIPILCKDASVSELIERPPVGANTSRGHLHCQLRSCVEATCVEVRVEQSVVARDVQAIDTLHLLHLHFLEEVNGADETSLSGKPLDDG